MRGVSFSIPSAEPVGNTFKAAVEITCLVTRDKGGLVRAETVHFPLLSGPYSQLHKIKEKAAGQNS